MIERGIVEDLQARMNILFRLPGRPDFSLECVVDTGFAGALTLPEDVIKALGLPFFQEIDANLANDMDVKADVYVGTIIWGGQEMEVAVLAMGRRPLLGTALLDGKRLCTDFVEQGEVTIETL
jgi:clan AA aspartic protease